MHWQFPSHPTAGQFTESVVSSTGEPLHSFLRRTAHPVAIYDFFRVLKTSVFAELVEAHVD